MNTLFDIDNKKNQVHWFVMMAYKREDEAEAALSGKDGLEFFIAKYYTVKVFHGVKKRMLVPYIPNIVFVHATQAQIVKFKETCNFLKFMTWRKQTGLEYITVPDDQMHNFIRIASSQCETMKYYSPDEIHIKKGTRVRVIGGQFDGVVGNFVKVKGKRNRQVVVIIPEVMAVSAEVDPDLIEVLE